VGQTIRVGNTPFSVVGVAGKKGQSATGQDYDDAAFIPSTTFAHRIQGGLGKYMSGQMYVQSTSSETTTRALEDVRALLRDRHKLAPGADDDFSIRNLAEIAGAQAEGTDTMTTLLASVAAVSLLVGGIGIMNIMLVSVTERTREIGIRMAIGAKPVGVASGVGVAISVAFSAAVGIVFGLYPARKASQLDPIDALRYE
jgi:putative ABC transport system permease protein